MELFQKMIIKGNLQKYFLEVIDNEKVFTR